MATCHFCRQEFENSQAVRAHLKGCVAYLNRSPRQAPEAEGLREPSVRENGLGSPSLGKIVTGGSGSPESESDLVRQLDQQIAAEQRRLRLRELKEAHKEMDRRVEARKLEREREATKQAETRSAAEREREAARQREAQVKQARENAASAELRRRTRRREIIQDIKHEVVENSWALVFAKPELKAEITLEIEQALAPLPVEDLPRDELMDIAKGVRTRLNSAAEQAEQRVRDQEQQLTDRRSRLQKHGRDYAERELKDAEGIDSLNRWSIKNRVERELRDVTGDESNADIEDWVDEILESEGLGYDDEEDG